MMRSSALLRRKLAIVIIIIIIIITAQIIIIVTLIIIKKYVYERDGTSNTGYYRVSEGKRMQDQGRKKKRYS